MNVTRGFIYVATGERYLAWGGVFFAGSYKAAMPDMSLHIFTNDVFTTRQHGCFDQCHAILVHCPDSGDFGFRLIVYVLIRVLSYNSSGRTDL